jgi:glycosyltransferase involved in cell wall biosynthesis
MAKSLHADLISGFFSEGSFDPRELGFEGKMITLGKAIFAKWIRHEVLKYRFEKKTKFLSEYDTVILSGNCLDAIRNIPKTTRKIYYCHTPPRYIFDLREEYMKRVPKIFHRVIHYFLDRKAYRYQKHLAQMDRIITNSKNVQNRLKEFTGYDSEIIYPPTDMNRFTPSYQEAVRSDQNGIKYYKKQWYHSANWSLITDYYLSFARLSPPKRVDLIVDAFLQMPEQNLIFCYGKNDPLKETVLKKVEW